MDRDKKMVIYALIILFVSMLSFNLNKITGKAVNYGLPDIIGSANFVNIGTGEEINSAVVGDKADILVTITNIGQGDASPGNLKNKVQHRLEIKREGIITKDRRLRKNFSVNNLLKQGTSFTKHLSYLDTQFRYFQFNAPGVFCLDLKLDTTNKLAESDEDNEFDNSGCVIVVEKGKSSFSIVPKEARNVQKFWQQTNDVPTRINIKLLASYVDRDDIVLLDEKTCELADDKEISCSFDINLEIGRDYVVRSSISTDLWKIKYARIIDDSNREFLRKSCNKSFCEIRTEDFLSPETKFNQYIRSGIYTIEATAEKA